MSDNIPMLIPKEEVEINVQFIYKSFIDNIESVNLYFKKFGTLAIGEDETIINKNNEFHKNFLSELTADLEKLKAEKENEIIQELLKIKWWDQEDKYHEIESNFFDIEKWLKKNS